MKKYRVFVVGQVEHTFDIEAEDEHDAESIAEKEFFNKFTCSSEGEVVEFDTVDSWDAEEVENVTR